MSPNVETVSELVAAMNRGDFDEALGFFHPDAELRDLVSAPDQAGVVTGVDAIRDVWVLWAREFEYIRADPEEWTEVGDTVIGRVHWHGRGKSSGVPIDVHAFDLYELREGKVVRVVLGFGSMEKAREAAEARG